MTKTMIPSIGRRTALGLGAALLSAPTVWAQDRYPNRPIRLLVPWAAGGTTDILARVLAEPLRRSTGQPFVVENRSGASGNIGTDFVARARPDGATLLVGSPGTMAINPFLFRSLPYRVEDFVAVSHLVSFPQVMVVNPNSPIRSLADLVQAAQARPGALNFATSGAGSTSHLAFELVRAATGIEMTHIPFRGGAPAIQAVMQGEVQVTIEGLPSLPGFLSNGQLRAIAVTSGRRAAMLPAVPAATVPCCAGPARSLLTRPPTPTSSLLRSAT